MDIYRTLYSRAVTLSRYAGMLALLAWALCACGKFDRSKIKMPEFDFVTTENLHSIAFVDPGHLWVSGNYGTILSSADGGKTWSAQDSGIDELLLGSLAFVDAGRIWAAGVGGCIVHTADGGKTWTRQPTPTEGNILDLFFLDAQRGWAVGEFGMIIHTADGGKTWVEQREPEDTLYNDVFFADADNGWIVGEFGTILNTRDGGVTWSRQECRGLVPAAGEFEWERPQPALYGLYFADAATGWIVGMDGVILKTSDGGAVWEKLDSGTDKPLYGICIRGQRGWVVGNKGTYLMSADGGTTWKVVDGAIKTKFWLRDVAFVNENTGLIVGERGTIARTDDGGETWDLVSGFRYDMEEFGLADF